MKILGLFGPGPNPSACLLVDSVVVSWVEQERLDRIKTSPNSLPIQAAKSCLKMAGLSLDEIDGIAYGWDCERYVKEIPEFFKNQRKKENDYDEFNILQEELFVNLYHPKRIKRILQSGLGSLSKTNKLPEIIFYSHHLCHAASTFYCSGFEQANILTLDGSGEEVTTLLATGNKNEIEEIQKFYLPNTLGGFYATFTEYLGFRPYHDEGKVMGLASYGKFDQDLQNKMDQVISYDLDTGEFKVNPRMRYVGKHTYGARFTDELVELFGPMRDSKTSALEKPYPDIAFALQWRLEQIVITLAKQLHRKTGLRKFCLAGGVAMNCVLNGKLAEQEFCDDIYVQPAASDNGVSLGAALLFAKNNGDLKPKRMEHMYWGPSYTNNQIKEAIEIAKLNYTKSNNVIKETAKFIADGKIVGWFQGRMEVGARALGNRSILASPVFPDMKDKINNEVKHREDWRPFCPSIKEEKYEDYIESSSDSPFMIMAFPVKEKIKNKIPSCVHIDGTARPQVVKKTTNSRYWELINEFEKITGFGVIINTSFNIQGEPIVLSPEHALRCFSGTGIDILVIGDFINKKPFIEIN